MTMTPADDLPCRELVELVTEHLEGALDQVTEQRMLQHLADCGDCETYLEQMRATAALAAALPAEELPEHLPARLAAAFRDARPR